MNHIIHFCLHRKPVVFLLLAFVIVWGVRVAPFDWRAGDIPRDPVAVDAIPDLGDNQQIVFTEWPGRSPQDVEDQITYPLTVSLLGVPGVKEVRSSSMFGYSSIYLIFEEDVEFYWSRSRVLEKLASLPSDTLPDDVAPGLGPDATGLGQIFWYYLEGRDPDGKRAGGWDPDELRTLQDWQVRYVLLAAEGVAEVASIGGYEREYQVDVDPDALRAYGVTLAEVADAVRRSNREIGARNLAINGVEYFIRATGYVEDVEDLRRAVVAVRDETPVTVGQVAAVKLGPAMRRGALDVNGADAAGGVVVSRFGANPMAAIKSTKEKIDELAAALPKRVVVDWDATSVDEVRSFAAGAGIDPVFVDPDSTELDQETWLPWAERAGRSARPEWMTTSKVTVVPFYDRSTLIAETLGTLNEALFQQILVTIIVVIVMVMHLRTSLLISAMLPLAVLGTFIAMKLADVDANIVALAGIAIAIGTVVDIGIVLTENVVRQLDEAAPDEARIDVIYRGVTEVAGAVTTSIATTVISFLPVFTMVGEAGRLFRPLAFTKTFAMIAAILIALILLPAVIHLLLGGLPKLLAERRTRMAALLALAAAVALALSWPLAVGLGLLAAGVFLAPQIPDGWSRVAVKGFNYLVALFVAWKLAGEWMPLGPGRGDLRNFLLVLVVVGGVLAAFQLFERGYSRLLTWCLDHKTLFLSLPLLLLVVAGSVWVGFDRMFGFLPRVFGDGIAETRFWRDASDRFPGLGREFRPSLDEGSFLYMPTVSPHASIDEAAEALRELDAAIAAIPEVSQVVGKIGRVESPLDPAPVSMIETVVNYVSEFKTDEAGRVLRFRTDADGDFVYQDGELVKDPGGRPFRQWRPEIRSADDIWREIDEATRRPGVTGAPKLQPIETRLVMLRTGMRAPMGLKIRGPSLEEIESFGLEIERLLRSGEVPGLVPGTVNADRIVGKPYLEIVPDRAAASRYGLNVADIQDTIETAIGGQVVGTSIKGRERHAIRVRYARERRDDLEAMRQVSVASDSGAPVPLGQLATIRYVRGPQTIKAEDTFLTGYVTFGAESGYAEVDVVAAARDLLAEKEAAGELVRPDGVRYEFAGNFESAMEFNRTLQFMLPICLGAIVMLLYLENRSLVNTLIVFSGVVVAWAGGFAMLWIYAQPGFLDFELWGRNLGEVFQAGPINLSTAVWVGFLALFGIATDDGVVMSTYLRQEFAARRPDSIAAIRRATLEAGMRRVRPCLMTTATTLLALLPVITATGRGADLMRPMAVPIFGGMLFALMTMFVVPVLFCRWQELALRRG